ncbi:metalloprotease m41 ftsh, putative [Ichthyophthirius multifiliis]|uniref:Metalloprotease m41 ftsh, putative n=1 Tax=Ichthyophthirius multifiliis TaxID=5932 RepID=G0QSQ6_ICHMU|nr:metalloprotease m41 ftsh, putative [Ichthyophthirius multifiliis]EGR31772.1 metalloprotease m41 ftsh, putative [Ichthyophthirius multifiliis]|eukprot:XP_004035258.1 metalloprotease m41 ftsh, putative [Ichthyophthirius multifiliis]
MFVGVGASRVRELFKKAREKAPSIIFIDEIDSVAGSRRGNDPSHARDTVNQILAEMDGFKQSDNVIVIGATNFEQAIDPAIKRPGRFDKIIHVPLPDIKGREQLFQYYLKNIKIQNDIQAKELARQTTGFSGADIQNMVNISILNAIKDNRDNANLKDFDYALDRIAMGVGRKNMFITEEDKKCTAIHESGHTIAALLTPGSVPLHKVTILPRGGALGFTSMIPETDKHNNSKKNMIAFIDVAMGGRAAEDLFMGNDQITTGCSNDLQKATEIAYQYIKYYAMNEQLSLISANDKIEISDQFNYSLDLEVQKILKESYQRVKQLLKANEFQLLSLTDQLVKNETLTAEQIKEIVYNNKKY